ncbi:uncharacterized protein LOC141708972 [Apium graveolens]|uniref:uncharacterized protein LOC141708972 n=1 Tax=Apium graveolens TaxID=4045 RepID=UPI003D7A0C85
MLEWNKAQLIGHLLKVITNSSTLWVSWVNKIVLKRKHFWTTKLPTDCSWIWKKILKLRPLALQFVSFRIGNGESISLWFDPWWNNACLASILTYAIISQCGMHHGDKLSAIIHNGSWCLPRANPRSHHLDPVLLHWLSTFDPPALAIGSDLLLWDGSDGIKTKTWEIWNSIRYKGDLIPIVGDSWVSFLITLAELPDKPKSTVALCFAQIFCYHVWRERNARAHDSGVLGPNKLLNEINKDVCARLHSSNWFSKIINSRPDLIPSNSL